MPAGLARPGSSSAASVTVDWQRQVPVSVVGYVPAPGHWVSVAELQPGGGMSGIPTGHTQSIATLGVLVATRHLVHENGCGNLAVHTHNNQCFETSVAVLAHSAAELTTVHYHYLWVIFNPASNFLYWVEPVDVHAEHLDRPPTVFPTVTAQVEGHFDLMSGVEVKGVFVLADADLPRTVGYFHSLAETGFLANDLFLMQRNLGYLTWTQPGPGNKLCELATTFG